MINRNEQGKDHPATSVIGESTFETKAEALAGKNGRISHHSAFAKV